MDNFLNLIDRHIDVELSRYKNQYYDQNIKKKKKKEEGITNFTLKSETEIY